MKKIDKSKGLDCADIEKMVQKYLDGYLSEKEVSLVEEHLDYCLPCDKKIEFEKKIKEFVKNKASEKKHPQNIDTKLKKILSNNDDLN